MEKKVKYHVLTEGGFSRGIQVTFNVGRGEETLEDLPEEGRRRFLDAMVSLIDRALAANLDRDDFERLDLMCAAEELQDRESEMLKLLEEGPSEHE